MPVAGEETRGLNYLRGPEAPGCPSELGWWPHTPGPEASLRGEGLWAGLVALICGAPHTEPLHATAGRWEPESGAFSSPRGCFPPKRLAAACPSAKASWLHALCKKLPSPGPTGSFLCFRLFF